MDSSKSNPKMKSGSEKRKEAEKRKLNEAGDNPKQSKLDKFRFSSKKTSSTNDAGCNPNETLENSISVEVTSPSSSVQNETVTVVHGTSEIILDDNGLNPSNQNQRVSVPSTSQQSGLEKFNFYSCKASINTSGSEMEENQDNFETETSENNIENDSAKEGQILIKMQITTTSEKFSNDKGLYENYERLNEDQILSLVLAGPCQPKECDMPDGKYKKFDENRRFSSKFYCYNTGKPFAINSPSSWLSYSLTKNYAYCHFCWLFGDESTKKSSWCIGFVDWKHIGQSIHKHGLSKGHLRSAVAASTFQKRADIRSKLNKQISEEAKKWRDILHILFDIVRTLASIGVAFRGHREQLENKYPGIYLSIVKLVSRHNPTLFAHIHSPERIKYLSKTITFELLDVLAHETRQSILQECKGAKFFSILADSTTDVAHLDQMAIMLRYVTVQDGNQNDGSNTPTFLIKESFLCFARLQQGDAEYIKNVLVDQLFETYGLQKKYLCGQGYDGAAVMAGNRGGVQALIKNHVGDQVFAPYVHCTAHQLNLVLLHVAENTASPSIKLVFATIQAVYLYFSHSHRRWENLLRMCTDSSRDSNSFGIALLNELRSELFEIRAENEEVEGDDLHFEKENPSKSKEKPRNLHLKSVSVTRWSARVKAVEAIIQNFECVVECLEIEISRNGAKGEDIAEARSLLTNLDWVFFLNILWWQAVLQIVQIAQVQLQKVQIDLMSAQNCILKAIESLKNLRNETAYYNFVNKSKNKWREMGWENADFPVLRKRRIKKMAGELTSDSPLELADGHRISYYEVLDNMCSELQERANGYKEINDIFGFLMPEKLKKMKEDDLRAQVTVLMKKYPDFFTTDLFYELSSFIGVFFDEHDHTKDGPIEYFKFITENRLIESFSELSSLLRLFLSIPVSTASVERVMSSLKFIKEYRRSTMTENTLNDYSILYIERDVAANVKLERTIEIFSEKKARRGFKLN